MIALTCIENYVNDKNDCYGSFLIEPLDVGQGITLGNALRRTLLSDLIGYGITGVRINNIKHEFADVKGIREDLLEILLNLKEIVFKPSFSIIQQEKLHFKGFLNIKGPLIVTAGLLKLPKNQLTIMNPTQYICTIVEDIEFYLEVDIDAGTGYQLTEERKRKNILEKFSPIRPSTLLVDGVFMPIRTVNYKVKLIHDTYGNIKESIVFEVITNGSISPKRSIQEALKILVNIFLPLFSIPEFPTLVSLAKIGKIKQRFVNEQQSKTRKELLKPIKNKTNTNALIRDVMIDLLEINRKSLKNVDRKIIKETIRKFLQTNKKALETGDRELIKKVVEECIQYVNEISTIH